jgi:ComF family protein
LLAVTLAPACAACGEVLESPLDGPVCGTCWRAVCPLARAGSSADLVAADYSGPLRDIIHAFKYEGRRSLARPLARLMAEAGGELMRDAACAVPVPLHPWKRVVRGFNQAADLARHLGPPVVHALWRARPTRAQVGLPAERRHRNVRGAFIASPLLGQRRRARYIAGRVVVLVDDVRTTGATLHECAEVLRAMGASEVRILTLAQAPAPES